MDCTRTTRSAGWSPLRFRARQRRNGICLALADSTLLVDGGRRAPLQPDWRRPSITLFLIFLSLFTSPLLSLSFRFPCHSISASFHFLLSWMFFCFLISFFPSPSARSSHRIASHCVSAARALSLSRAHFLFSLSHVHTFLSLFSLSHVFFLIYFLSSLMPCPSPSAAARIRLGRGGLCRAGARHVRERLQRPQLGELGEARRNTAVCLTDIEGHTFCGPCLPRRCPLTLFSSRVCGLLPLFFTHSRTPSAGRSSLLAARASDPPPRSSASPPPSLSTLSHRSLPSALRASARRLPSAAVSLNQRRASVS